MRKKPTLVLVLLLGLQGPLMADWGYWSAGADISGDSFPVAEWTGSVRIGYDISIFHLLGFYGEAQLGVGQMNIAAARVLMQSRCTETPKTCRFNVSGGWPFAILAVLTFHGMIDYGLGVSVAYINDFDKRQGGALGALFTLKSREFFFGSSFRRCRRLVRRVVKSQPRYGSLRIWR